jgi:hypothetical protein
MMTELEVDRTLRIDREVTARALPMRPDGETLSAVFALPPREHDPEGKIAKAIIQDAKMNALRRAFVDSGAIWNGRMYTIQFDEERERVPEFYGRFADGVRLHLSVRPVARSVFAYNDFTRYVTKDGPIQMRRRGWRGKVLRAVERLLNVGSGGGR